MDKIYLERRKKDNCTSYRLNKRTEVIISSLNEFINNGVNSILDVGTADGIMLYKIANHFNIRRAVGIDVSDEALRIAGQLSRIKVSLGSFVNLPFKDETFDIVLASAVLEHIEDGDAALKEAYRVLTKSGLFCITLPNPFYDWINSKLVKTYHVRRYRLKDITCIMESYGFKIVKACHFMLWPFGKVFFSEPILKFIKFLGLDFLLFNHITIGLKI